MLKHANVDPHIHMCKKYTAHRPAQENFRSHCGMLHATSCSRMVRTRVKTMTTVTRGFAQMRRRKLQNLASAFSTLFVGEHEVQVGEPQAVIQEIRNTLRCSDSKDQANIGKRAARRLVQDLYRPDTRPDAKTRKNRNARILFRTSFVFGVLRPVYTVQSYRPVKLA